MAPQEQIGVSSPHSFPSWDSPTTSLMTSNLFIRSPHTVSPHLGCGTAIGVWVWIHICARSLTPLLKSPVTLARPSPALR